MKERPYGSHLKRTRFDVIPKCQRQVIKRLGQFAPTKFNFKSSLNHGLNLDSIAANFKRTLK